ncbi:MAG: hypothetical protein HY372_03125 [Candidatus Andersenbacteria bacterium]|nr:hypothetical protein [Candidatus Andersenbacteria bacterium]
MTTVMEDNRGPGEGSFLDRIKESPRTVSALIIILIVAAAIYAFSGEETSPVAQTTDEAASTTAPRTAESTPREPQPQVAAEVTPDQSIEEQAASLPTAQRTDEGYVEAAQAGDGFTHLARRAATRWLSENQAGYAVSAEHRIYIEDYIQNRLGTRYLALGEEQTIAFDLVREAVAAAGELNEQQLRNLTKYTSAL